MKKNNSLAKTVFVFFLFVLLFTGCKNLQNDNEIGTIDSLKNVLKISLGTNARYISAYDFDLSNYTTWTCTFKDENDSDAKEFSVSTSVLGETNTSSLSYSNGTLTAKNIPTGTFTITIEGFQSEENLLSATPTYTVLGSKTGVEIVKDKPTETSVFVGLKKTSSGYGGLTLTLNNAEASNYFSKIYSAEAKLISRSTGTVYSTSDENSVLHFDSTNNILESVIYPTDSDDSTTYTSANNIPSGWYTLSFTLDGYSFYLADTEIEIADGLATSATISVTATTSKTYYATNDVATGNGLSSSSRTNLTTLLENLADSLPSEQQINIYVNAEPKIDLYTLSKLESKLASTKNEYRTVTIYNPSDSETMKISVTYKSDERTYIGSVESISNSITLIGSTVDETDYKTVDVGQIDTTIASFSITLVDGVAINLTNTNANTYLAKTLGIKAVVSTGSTTTVEDNLSAYYDTPFITISTNAVANKIFDVTTGYVFSSEETDGTYAYYITYITMKNGTDIKDTLTSITKDYSNNTLSFKAYTGDSSNIETSNTLSSEDSITPCYVWLDSTNSAVYYYAEGYTDSEGTHLILLNEDSSYMFYECEKFTEIDISGFSTKNVTNMSYMFSFCSVLTTLDVSGFDITKVKCMDYMFNGCSSLTTIYAASNADWSSVSNSDNMFTGCSTLVGGNKTAYNSNKVTATYARIDTTENPGYFTAKSSTE